jgi:hypothetical protein
MATIALCFPIVPGKKQKWQEMAAQFLKGPLKSRMDAARAAAGVHERTYLQETPKGDFVIVTLEGATPFESFGKLLADPAMADFGKWAADVHGFDPNAPPPAPPKLVYDSRG